ncbi:hypothetical protein ABZ946_33345 [Streptomyces sp. NPDC046324]|uniref:hypothetical protein n=1 Tax=Streptomyces sp. NPDC046324 TaxID=3154915 RepID=UPI0033DAD77A
MAAESHSPGIHALWVSLLRGDYPLGHNRAVLHGVPPSRPLSVPAPGPHVGGLSRRPPPEPHGDPAPTRTSRRDRALPSGLGNGPQLHSRTAVPRALGVRLRIAWRSLVLGGHRGAGLLRLLDHILAAEPREQQPHFADCSLITSTEPQGRQP